MTKTPETQLSAAVTGAGSGLGRDVALGLAAKGYRVFGTAMASAEIQDLEQASGGAVTLTLCDITDEAAVRSWAAEVACAHERGLNILINNAGILTPGPLEILPLDAIRHEFEVNVFGALAVVNAFLPALRKACGRVVQVSTMTASLPCRPGTDGLSSTPPMQSMSPTESLKCLIWEANRRRKSLLTLCPARAWSRASTLCWPRHSR